VAVFVVVEDCYSGAQVVAVYSTFEKADEYTKNRPIDLSVCYYTIVKMEVDAL
jgi:hypothetical protein